MLRELVGSNKYFEGTCLFAFQHNEVYYSWKKLKVYVLATTFRPDQVEVQRWIDYDRKCEDTTLKMEGPILDGLNFKRVHSNFEYFEDGTFKNLEPFTDIDGMLANLQGFLA